MDTSMPLDVPADATASGEEFFRTEAVYTSLGAPIPGGEVGRWILREGPHIDSGIELFDELCWRLVGDGVPLWRATLNIGTLHPQIRGIGARWMRERNFIERYRILQGSEGSEEFLRSPIRATIERGTPFRRRLINDTPEYPLLSKIRSAGATDYFALALNRTFQRFPVVAWATDRPEGFSEADIAKLEEINPALAAIVEAREIRRITEDLLDTYLGPQAGRRVLAGQIQRAEGERLRAVIMMADMRGFTALSDRLPGEEVIELLDDLLARQPVGKRGETAHVGHHDDGAELLALCSLDLPGEHPPPGLRSEIGVEQVLGDPADFSRFDDGRERRI